MKLKKLAGKELFYTKDYEWIDFQGNLAYTGVCGFKLLGFKEIHELIFNHLSGFIKRGAVIATVKYKDYEIKAHMPVDGTIMEVNKELFSNNKNILLQKPETRGWIALVMPAEPTARVELLPLKKYELRFQRK